MIYTDWQRGNYWRAVAGLTGPVARIGIEGDHLTLAARDALGEVLSGAEAVDIAPATQAARMIKSTEEVALIREGARIADLGGAAVREAIREGAREIDVAMAGRDAMEAEIARAHPASELRDTWVWVPVRPQHGWRAQPGDGAQAGARRYPEPQTPSR